jgi:hypothetical protein
MTERELSAQVVLLPASGVPVEPARITAATLGEVVPARDVAERVQGEFAALGFRVGPLVGNNFSITAPAATFEQVFQGAAGQTGLELPLEALPASVQPAVQAVTFTPPPAFGPTGV